MTQVQFFGLAEDAIDPSWLVMSEHSASEDADNQLALMLERGYDPELLRIVTP